MYRGDGWRKKCGGYLKGIGEHGKAWRRPVQGDAGKRENMVGTGMLEIKKSTTAGKVERCLESEPGRAKGRTTVGSYKISKKEQEEKVSKMGWVIQSGKKSSRRR